MATGDIHVMPNGAGRWKVTQDGTDTPLSTHDTQSAGEAEGRRIAKDAKVEFMLHGENGQIREKDSYGNDPSGSSRG